jgi:hypothetical protein
VAWFPITVLAPRARFTGRPQWITWTEWACPRRDPSWHPDQDPGCHDSCPSWFPGWSDRWVSENVKKTQRKKHKEMELERCQKNANREARLKMRHPRDGLLRTTKLDCATLFQCLNFGREGLCATHPAVFVFSCFHPSMVLRPQPLRGEASSSIR